MYHLQCNGNSDRGVLSSQQAAESYKLAARARSQQSFKPRAVYRAPRDDLGPGVGRGLGVGGDRGVGVGLGVAVGVGLGVVVAVAVGVAVAVAVTVGVGDAVGVGVPPPVGNTRT